MKTGSRGNTNPLWLTAAVLIGLAISAPASYAAGGALNYEPKTHSVGLLAGQAVSFVLSVECKGSDVTVAFPSVVGIGSHPIPQAWVSGDPGTFTFSEPGTRDFVVTITAPPDAAPGQYAAHIRAHVVAGKAQDGMGCNTTVTVATPPVCGFTYSPGQPQAGQAVQFTDLSSDADGSVVAWQWDFGDGDVSNEQNPTHSYSDAGSYVVTLTVTDDDGLSAALSQQLQVENGAAEALLTYGGRPTAVDVRYSGQHVSGPDGTVLLSAQVTNPEAEGDDPGDWPKWVVFTVIDVNGQSQPPVYAEVVGEGGTEATASAAVVLPPGAYLVWADIADPAGRFQVASEPAPTPIAVGEPAGAVWGASDGSAVDGIAFAVSAWDLDTAQPKAQFVCLVSDGDQVEQVVWGTAAQVANPAYGVVSLSGTCITDGVHDVGFGAEMDASQGTFSLSLENLWAVEGSLQCVAAPAG